ncbi:MAG TPA: ABC transporter permease subunit [Gemmatimonadaceae bacterium]|nr:ABC transporter permease subunit [Gemmatimonadaceae bacterium]
MTSGTVFDIGYRNYTGAREGRGRAFKAMYKDGIRIALGLGRGGRAKILPWFFLVALSAMGLVMALISGAADRLGGPGTANKIDLPTHSDFYGIMGVIIFVFAALVGPELLCRDRRDGVINLYLVRPLTGSDYVVSRWLAFLTIMLIATWFPQFILFLGLSMGDPAPMQYLAHHWVDIPKFLAAGLAMAVYATTLAMLTASFTTRRAYASVFLVGLFVITVPFTVGLSHNIEGAVGQWISMFDLTNIPVHVNDIIFDKMSEMSEHAPAKKLGSAVLVGWYFLWTIVPATVLWARYRRLSP